MSSQSVQNKKLKSFADIAQFLEKLNQDLKNEIYKFLNGFIFKYLQDHLIKTIGDDTSVSFNKNENSFATFLKRAVYNFI